MKIRVSSTCTILLIGWLLMNCQSKKDQTNLPDQPPTELATLTKAAYTVGDSVTIQLSRPLTQLAVLWDNKASVNSRVVNTEVSIGSAGESIGLHQVVIKGITADKKQVADTLSVELWSDIKPRQLQYSVLQTYPHQTTSFTQGLEFYKGALYEGTGLNGQSKLMKVELKSGAILQSTALPDQYFGEGITIVNDRIYQLTWTSGQCFQYSMNLGLLKTFTYHTQGWGLTHQDTTLIVSDGSNRLSYYSPSFRKTGELAVYDNKGPVMNLNELEYVNGYILANVWQTNRIVQIEPTTGKVVGELIIDPTLAKGVDTKENVLNGIAHLSTEKALYITGKNWPTLFKIQVKGLFTKVPKELVASR